MRHVPVLLSRCLDLMAPALDGGGVVIDATVGMGGHSQAILQRFPDVQVVGIDRDPQAIALASARLADFGNRFTAVHTTYDEIEDVAVGRNVRVVLMDLGVSSYQLDEDDRGFAYSRDTALDMRMDPTTGISAAQLIATADPAELVRILRVYGEEKFAKQIVSRLVARRDTDPVMRSGQLVEVVRQSIPAAARRRGGNPAKRTFQALRVAVNHELDILERALPAALAVLPVRGRMVVESYQSLEDRMVKAIFRKATTANVPSGVPVVPEHLKPKFSLLTSGAERASAAEQEDNPRSAPVRLRAVERICLESENQ
ncbi:MAG: 16S rRNA (cytosine(1402)-N(4))-methyltransferase RsmH [Actinomycetaceae bacterium]|nr:16S rRNA (cytosine(1402)-N(4))-methyltransferase RsmH [Actinomycetaceae bacterium]